MFNSQAVSFCKAIAIILMVEVHANMDYSLLKVYIDSFHMPLFFIMSGYCFKVKYLDDPKSFFKRRFKGLWWPFVKWCFIFMVAINLIRYFHLSDAPAQSLAGFCRDVFNTLRLRNSPGLLGSFWVLAELFWASVIGFLCIKYLKKPLVWGGVLLTLLLLQIVVPVLIIIPKSWMGALFFLIGYEWRQNEERGGLLSQYETLGWKKQLIVLLALLCVQAVCIWNNGWCNMKNFTVLKAIPFMVGGVCGTGVVMVICRWLSACSVGWLKSVLNFIGWHTLEVVTWHALLFVLTTRILNNYFGMDKEDVPGNVLLYMAIGVGLPVLWQWARLSLLAKWRNRKSPAKAE